MAAELGLNLAAQVRADDEIGDGGDRQRGDRDRGGDGEGEPGTQFHGAELHGAALST
jgi:hypothetical protein